MGQNTSSQGNRVKDLCGEEACEEVVVPGGGFSPEAQGILAGGVIGSDAAFVVAEDHVHHPVQAVLDRPVAADDGADLACEPGERGDVEAGLALDLSAISRALSTMTTPCSPGHWWRCCSQLADLDQRLKKLDGQLQSICRSHDACRRLADLPGVGPVIATALVSAVDDGRHFRSGRELAAWIGLTPRQHTTGGKPRLGGIGRRANHYLRRQMIHGARSVMCRLAKYNDRRSQWLKDLAARRGFNRALVALANKTARIAWVLLARKEEYVAA